MLTHQERHRRAHRRVQLIVTAGCALVAALSSQSPNHEWVPWLGLLTNLAWLWESYD